MKLYIGNHQNVELDLNDSDIIHLFPTSKARGGYWNNKEKKAFRVVWYNGTTSNMKYFYYTTSKTRYECYTYEGAEAAAKEYYDANNKNTIYSIIPILAKDITPKIVQEFRYIQPSIEYEYKEVPLDSRWLGIWLGDGSKASSAITNVDPEIIKYIYDHADKLNMKVSISENVTYNSVNKSRQNSNPIKEVLKSLDVLNNKHIPDIYLYNSKEIRLQLLAGIIDTDGYLDGSNYEIVQKSERLAKDIQILANGLGFFTRCIDKLACATNTIAKTKRIYKRMHIYPNYNTPLIPLLLERKQLDPSKIIEGIPMKLEKTDRKHINKWTDEMKDKYQETVLKYTKNGRVQWTELVKNEDLYKHLTSEAMRNTTLNTKVALK